MFEVSITKPDAPSKSWLRSQSEEGGIGTRVDEDEDVYDDVDVDVDDVYDDDVDDVDGDVEGANRRRSNI